VRRYVRTAPTAWTVLAIYLRPQWTHSLALAVLLLVAIGLKLANPQLLRSFIDSATQGVEIDRLIDVIALIFLAVAVASQVVAIAETYLPRTSG
jgi:ABC-type multidrug transport system fused ATPase/permease subunit